MDDEFEDWELLDLCPQCGLWPKENHLCKPNDGEYTSEEFEILKQTARRKIAVRKASDFIREKRAKIEEEKKIQRQLEAEKERNHQMVLLKKIEKKSRNLLYEIEEFRDKIRKALRIPQGEPEPNPDQEVERDAGLIKFEDELENLRAEAEVFSNGWNMDNEIGRVRKVLIEIREVLVVIKNLQPWHAPKKEKPRMCTCDDYPSIQCPLHPGRN